MRGFHLEWNLVLEWGQFSAGVSIEFVVVWVFRVGPYPLGLGLMHSIWPPNPHKAALEVLQPDWPQESIHVWGADWKPALINSISPGGWPWRLCKMGPSVMIIWLQESMKYCVLVCFPCHSAFWPCSGHNDGYESVCLCLCHWESISHSLPLDSYITSLSHNAGGVFKLKQLWNEWLCLCCRVRRDGSASGLRA